MKTRARHRTVGLILLLPFVAWSATALFFLLKPGYEQAYAPLETRVYPLQGELALALDPAWQEVRYLRTVLGEHLLVRRDGVWAQVDPATGASRERPDEAALQRLLSDAIQVDSERYGSLEGVEDGRFLTSTGVEITFDWNSLSLRQRGRDTRFIDQLYEIHYLQWTGIGPLDRVLGVAGLCLLLFMTWTGARLALGRRRPAAPRWPAPSLAGEA